MHCPTLNKSRRRLLGGALASLALSGAALAQGFPGKPVTIVVPFVAGSPTDVAARAFATDCSLALNTPVILDNRPECTIADHPVQAVGGAAGNFNG